MSTGTRKILIMDDEEIIREVAGEMLKHFGYEVEVAKDGAEALEKYANAMKSGTSFDAVIMDLTIPGGPGGKQACVETCAAKALKLVKEAPSQLDVAGYDVNLAPPAPAFPKMAPKLAPKPAPKEGA